MVRSRGLSSSVRRGVDPGGQVFGFDQSSQQAPGFSEVAVGVPPGGVAGDSGGAAGVAFGVGAVAQELGPFLFPVVVGLEPEDGLVGVADVHQCPGEGEDFASGVESGFEGVVSADGVEDVEVAALDACGGPVSGDRGV